MYLKHRCVVAVLAAAVLVVLSAALPAAANVSVSTSDGVTLTLTNTGAFSSLTVNGNTAPTLSGVNGGFFIVPMDGVSIDATRHTYYAGTQVTGTATQSGNVVTITTSAIQNQTFTITLTGGLPYIKVDGTVTGNGTDHAFLVDFRLPVNANNWTWCNAVAQQHVQWQCQRLSDHQHVFEQQLVLRERRLLHVEAPATVEEPLWHHYRLQRQWSLEHGDFADPLVLPAGGLCHRIQQPNRALHRVRVGNHVQDHPASQHRGLPLRALPAQSEVGEPLGGAAVPGLLPPLVRTNRLGRKLVRRRRARYEFRRLPDHARTGT